MRKVLQHIRRKFLVISGKGAVGKTSVAVNLAVALSDSDVTKAFMELADGILEQDRLHTLAS